MNLSDYKIYDIYGIRNIPLQGTFDADSLSQKLIDEWIPYIDCERKCPRSDYCKYTQPSPYHPDRLTDVKCGIGVNTLKNTLLSVLSTFLRVYLLKMYRIISMVHSIFLNLCCMQKEQLDHVSKNI